MKTFKKILNNDRKLATVHFSGSFSQLLFAALLLIGIAAFTSGCAAAKCDCPKFGGHRLHH